MWYRLCLQVQLLSSFRHPNIVQYVGTVREDGYLYIFLELIRVRTRCAAAGRCMLQSCSACSLRQCVLKISDHILGSGAVLQVHKSWCLDLLLCGASSAGAAHASIH
jgi:hypothetical protein